MTHYLYILLLLTLFAYADADGQSQQFIIKIAPFSSGIYDEFSPVYYKGGIVYCSNQSDNSLVNFNDGQNRLFKIFYAAQKDSTGWKRPKILAKEIITGFNDGPVTFNESGNIMYYSRNNSIENLLRNISDTSNKLGIYSAELVNDIWTNIKPFSYNNILYSLSTPALTPDGERIYFASDIPGGCGGMDLYYCDRLNDEWDNPVNPGPVINTSKNESFPFAGNYGKLFFASDGHKGNGGKDIFYTQEIRGKWITPVQLDSSINSTADDFGFMTDSTFENGYFSSNRIKTDDIFSFTSPPVEFTNCDTIKENKYCFTFYDEQHQFLDTVQVNYQWDFGNGIIRTGAEVKHCFPGPGKYSVKLSIVDELTGEAIAEQVEYNVELENIEQTYINSYNVGITGEPVLFDGLMADLKEFNATDYFWNFGDGFNPGGPSMKKAFKKIGEYTIQLGLLGEKDSLGLIPKRCTMKNIRIYNGFQELALKGERGGDKENWKTDSPEVQFNTMQIIVYLMDDLSGQQKVKITEVLRKPGEVTVKFDKFGIMHASYPFLDDVAGILKVNPDIRLEIAVHAIVHDNAAGISERRSEELAFYLLNRGIDKNSFDSKGFGLDHQLFRQTDPESKAIDGIIEFIFLKK